MNVEPPVSLSSSEADRLLDVASFDMSGTPHEEPFDGIAEVASALFETPYALLTIIDAHHQWFKAAAGTEMRCSPRALALCETTLAERRTIVVDDLSKDDRFAAHPLVTGPEHLRFYAGTPLISFRGHAIGTLCVLDVRPRRCEGKSLRLLERLARQAIDALETRRLVQNLLDGLSTLEGSTQ